MAEFTLEKARLDEKLVKMHHEFTLRRVFRSSFRRKCAIKLELERKQSTLGKQNGAEEEGEAF